MTCGHSLTLAWSGRLIGPKSCETPTTADYCEQARLLRFLTCMSEARMRKKMPFCALKRQRDLIVQWERHIERYQLTELERIEIRALLTKMKDCSDRQAWVTHFSRLVDVWCSSAEARAFP